MEKLRRVENGARNFIDKVRLERHYRSSKELTDFEAINAIDRHLARELGHEGLIRLQAELRGAQSYVVDLAASRTVLRAIAFFDAVHTLCIDPCYEFFETRGMESFRDRDPDVYGSAAEKANMTTSLKQILKQIEVPDKISGHGNKIIKGKRKGIDRTIELCPQDAKEWVSSQASQTIPNLIIWRAFPSATVWGKAIEALRIGGFLMTTGYGKFRHFTEEGEVTEDKDHDPTGFTGGIDVDNSPLPRNGLVDELGLRGLTSHPDIFFYQKTRHIVAEEIARAIRENR
ncbi:MAG: hypothetical protein HYW86_04150 [Candidatus Roizmanbacteria bacterium]|nr:MAG: hypothetical protein HYW86_04150 [Candidatus Roizmanbacteria bacterium]